VSRPSSAHVVLGACVAGALVLAAGLVAVTASAPADVPALGGDQVGAPGGACSGGYDPGDTVTVATWMSNTSGLAARVRSVEARSAGGLDPAPALRVVVRGEQQPDGGTSFDPRPGELGGTPAAARDFTVPAHGGAWLVVDLHLATGTRAAWVADFAVTGRGPSGIERTTVVPQLMGVARTSAACGRMLEDHVR